MGDGRSKGAVANDGVLLGSDGVLLGSLLTIITITTAGLALVACGDAASAADDSQPPEIRDVQATLGGSSGGALDLAKSSARRVITGATPLTVKVFATDDQTKTESLIVRALDAQREPLADQAAKLHNGLWRISLTAKPGLTVRVAVADAAGNEAAWPHPAVFPTRSQALIRQWTLLVYDAAGDVVDRPSYTVTADRWCQQDDAADGGPRGGSWSVGDDGRLKLETRHQKPCTTGDFGSEWGSIEEVRIAEFYVDATYFSDRPYARQGGGAKGSLAGTWSYKVEIKKSGADKTVTPSLVLRDDKTFEQQTEGGRKLSGTYRLEHNSDYANNFGDLLLLVVTKIDGASVAKTTVAHYYALRDDRLLVDPFIKLR